MKLVLFGGFIFVGGAIMFSAYIISTSNGRYILSGLGSMCMILGAVIGIAGIILKEK